MGEINLRSVVGNPPTPHPHTQDIQVLLHALYCTCRCHLPGHDSAMFWRFGKELIMPETNCHRLLARVDQLRGWYLHGQRTTAKVV